MIFENHVLVSEVCMYSFLLSLMLFLPMCLSEAQAAVWNSTQTWNSYWESEYQSWVEDRLRTDVFTSYEGVLGRLHTDCADALYAIRIQFAYEHSLPFVITAPDILKAQIKIFSSETSMFDSVKDEKKRVRAFIRFVLEECGTDDLFNDTFPVKMKEINAGIVYVVEWSFLGKTNRHSYILKGFNADNELLYYASDAPKKIRELQVDTKYPRFSYGSSPFGFRRWKHPAHLLIPEKNIPQEEGYSDEQYVLLRKVGKKQILKEIRKIIQN
jgi:hypothetical protein